ncbi:MAG: M15 family metallopeptidase [Eubacterium sp.]|nr:M15 family metallopeptidase [Eubacterium sp.]
MKKRKRVLKRNVKVIGIMFLVSITLVIVGARQVMPTRMPEGKRETQFLYQEENKTKSNALQNKAKRIYQNNKDLLVLVNRTNEMPDTYIRQLTAICEGRLEADERIVKDLREMLAAADRSGYLYFIASAYRSREKQEYLVQKNISDLMAQGMDELKAKKQTYKYQQLPGHSEHETGLALDILCSDNLTMENWAQAKLAGNKWLRRNAHKYGFVLRYPKKKENITLIKYESWHFRYVGKEAAEFMWENGLTLEEFHEIL